MTSFQCHLYLLCVWTTFGLLFTLPVIFGYYGYKIILNYTNGNYLVIIMALNRANPSALLHFGRKRLELQSVPLLSFSSFYFNLYSQSLHIPTFFLSILNQEEE